MEIIVDQELLDEVNTFINNKLVKHLSDAGVSIEAMTFILQILLEAVDEAQDKLDK